MEEKNICYTAESKQVPQNFNQETYLSLSLGIQTSAHRKMLFLDYEVTRSRQFFLVYFVAALP